MPNDGSVINGVATAGPCADPCDLEKQCVEGRDFHSSVDSATADGDHTVINIVVSNGESFNQVDVIPEPVGKISNAVDSTIRGEVADAVSLKKPHLSRNNSSHEQCRVCQQEKEEDLIDLGCQCRGGLAKAHRLCINTWFRMRGSNRCEICQQVAANVAPPESQPSASYWVWRVDPVFGSTIGQERQRGCFSPLWVAFSILIGGLLLDVLISITLGVSALPVNIIIGVVVLLGLGTALRLAVEFCHEWGVRRVVQRVETNVNVNFGYHPAL